MLTELPERDARGEIADIFAEIRRLYAVPYVSSIHRHMATRPGVLEWAWELAGPAFRSGEAQAKAWAIASQVALTPMLAIPPEALATWGIGPDDVASVRSIADSFTRVAPVNLVFGGIVREVLSGRCAPAGSPTRTANGRASLPEPLPPLPAFAGDEQLGETGRALLQLFRSGQGATAFVPGLYRLLARWPGLLAHLAVELGPRFRGPEKTAVAQRLIAELDAYVGALAQSLPAASRPAPSATEALHLVQMIDGYRVTSPEMILFGRLIREALPH